MTPPPFIDPAPPRRQPGGNPARRPRRPRRPWIPALILSLILAEIILLVEVGRLFGLTAVLGLTVAGIGLGLLVFRHQGLLTLRHAQAALSRGEPPVEAMLHAAGLTLAGILLIIPGLLTGAAGLLLLVPGLRRVMIRRLTAAMIPPPGQAGTTLDLHADPPDSSSLPSSANPGPPDRPPPPVSGA